MCILSMKALSDIFSLSFSLKTEYYKMSFQIFYEDGHGNAVDEYGRPEPMDYIIDEERYALETVSSHTLSICIISLRRIISM